MGELAGPAWLFCPADRAERFAKAAAAADVVILDLEDGVSPANRELARRALVSVPLDPERTVVRVNPADSDEHRLDLAAIAGTHYRRVMLAKTESTSQLERLESFDVVALCETPAGVLAAGQIAFADNVIALMWGAEDLIAALGGESSRHENGVYRDVARQARSSILLAASVGGKVAVDAVYLDIPDLDGLAHEAVDAAASGFQHKACIHPSQAEVVRAAYRPTAQRVNWARRVLAAAVSNRGVFTLDGRMIDEPLLRQARQLLERA